MDKGVIDNLQNTIDFLNSQNLNYEARLIINLEKQLIQSQQYLKVAIEALEAIKNSQYNCERKCNKVDSCFECICSIATQALAKFRKE